MTTQTWIEIAGLVIASAGGGKLGAGMIARATRLVVAVETLAEKLDALATQQAATAGTVQQHEARLTKGGL